MSPLKLHVTCCGLQAIITSIRKTGDARDSQSLATGEGRGLHSGTEACQCAPWESPFLKTNGCKHPHCATFEPQAAAELEKTGFILLT